MLLRHLGSRFISPRSKYVTEAYFWLFLVGKVLGLIYKDTKGTKNPGSLSVIHEGHDTKFFLCPGWFIFLSGGRFLAPGPKMVYNTGI
jgi:hypothetical protein